MRAEKKLEESRKMDLSEKAGIEGKTFVVTGGLGFVGAALCFELVRRGALQVRTLDLRTTSPWSRLLKETGVLCIQGDITCKKDVERVLDGAHCVFHLASYGMSGKEMLQVRRVNEVNVNGTLHVLEACLEFGIKRLVYVSTYNVVFGGREIVNGDETLPYFPIDDHVDPYGRTKSIAEQLVLKANGQPFKKNKKDGNCLHTCAVRPAAIYGPGEERHLPRIVNLAKLGLLLFRTGEPSVKTDWVYVDNLVLALILASMGLLDDIPGREGQPVAAGQPYFISDGYPVNTFEFISPLLQGLDCNLPKQSLTVPHALLVGRFFWVVYSVLAPWLNQWWLPQPLILPAEIYKVGVTHYFSFSKAKEELGYVPSVSPREAMAETISYWQERERRTLHGPTIYPWLFCVIGMTSLISVAWLPDIGPVPMLRAIALFFFHSMTTIRIVFAICATTHVGEALYAWYLAKRVDPPNARRWFWRTLILATFQLRFLLKRASR